MPRFGTAVNRNVNLRHVALNGARRRSTEFEPVFVEVPAPTEAMLAGTAQDHHPVGKGARLAHCGVQRPACERLSQRR